MGRSVLLIHNSKLYSDISKEMHKFIAIFRELEFDVQILDEAEQSFDISLENFIDETKKRIECKAVITCNGIGMERFTYIEDFLYCTYIQKHPNQYQNILIKANRNSIIFCFNQEYMNYIKEKFSNITNVIYVPLSEMTDNESWLMAMTNMALEIQEQIVLKQGNASILKLLIQRELNNGNLQQANGYMTKYKGINPEDMDLIVMETMLHFYNDNLDLALQFALEGVRKYPCNGDMYYNLARIYEKQENWYRALINYGRAFYIYLYIKNPKSEKLQLSTSILNCKEHYEASIDSKQYMGFEDMYRTRFGLLETAFREPDQQVIGKYFWESGTEKRFVGIYRDSFLRAYMGQEDLIHMKGEFVKVVEGNDFIIDQFDTEVLLPIAVENPETIHEIWEDDKRYVIEQKYNKHFNYYRLSSRARIHSSMKSYYGRPIPLCQKKDKKKLVLCIFVDGLAQSILKDGKFEKNMPNTFHFFEKGIICTDVFSTAEWTYPSIATYVTGMDSIHHMLFHNMLDCAIPENYPTLAEYFQEKGYFTAKMCGNWRIIPTYGHARGYDQFIYQHQWVGFKAETIIEEVIDHIEAFKETNQFLWMSIGDLHDIADGIDLPNSVQSSMKIKNYVQEKQGSTSVKQEYSDIKIKTYEKMAKRIDILLNILYQYLEENYKDDDIVISLFSDHGQGYLVSEREHFMAKGRSNVAFMFRGAEIKPQICDEIISTSDYIKIMCKLADIEMKEIEIDGSLPKAFGGQGREYALSESIHPQDPYYAAIYSEDVNFFFENPYPIQDDGRFYLKEYKAWLTDKRGNVINNWKKFRKYLNIIMEHIKPLLIYD